MPHRGTSGCRAPAAVLRIHTAKSISDCGEDVATAEGRGARSDGLTEERLLDFLRGMIEIRLFEDEIQLLFNRNLVRGSTHLCSGQEAVAVGACASLRASDAMLCTYRGHGAVLAMGAP